MNNVSQKSYDALKVAYEKLMNKNEQLKQELVEVKEDNRSKLILLDCLSDFIKCNVHERIDEKKQDRLDKYVCAAMVGEISQFEEYDDMEAFIDKITRVAKACMEAADK